GGSLLNLIWSFAGLNQAPLWLFGTQMIVMVANAFVMANSAAGEGEDDLRRQHLAHEIADEGAAAQQSAEVAAKARTVGAVA
ncbi:hypothetical protein, partial [Bradyrhizobium uaiense]